MKVVKSGETSSDIMFRSPKRPTSAMNLRRSIFVVVAFAFLRLVCTKGSISHHVTPRMIYVEFDGNDLELFSCETWWNYQGNPEKQKAVVGRDFLEKGLVVVLSAFPDLWYPLMLLCCYIWCLAFDVSQHLSFALGNCQSCLMRHLAHWSFSSVSLRRSQKRLNAARILLHRLIVFRVSLRRWFEAVWDVEVSWTILLNLLNLLIPSRFCFQNPKSKCLLYQLTSSPPLSSGQKLDRFWGAKSQWRQQTDHTTYSWFGPDWVPRSQKLPSLVATLDYD